MNKMSTYNAVAQYVLPKPYKSKATATVYGHILLMDSRAIVLVVPYTTHEYSP